MWIVTVSDAARGLSETVYIFRAGVPSSYVADSLMAAGCSRTHKLLTVISDG